MDFLEKDLEEIIYNDAINCKGENLFERGLWGFVTPFKIFRQKRIGGYGIADLITISRDPNELSITVIELKRDVIVLDHIIQLLKYMKGVNRYLEKRKFSEKFSVCGTIIGKSIDNRGDWVYLLEEINNISFYTYKYNIDGIRFTSECPSYYLTNEEFGDE